MQYEHTSAEELKEVAERQAVEIAEKVSFQLWNKFYSKNLQEENWEIERQVLKEEISSLRQRITSTAGKCTYLNITVFKFQEWMR
jgi:hypothetical protein